MSGSYVGHSQPQVRIAKSALRNSILKTVAKVFSYSILAVLVIYLCFAATIVRVVPVWNDLGFTPVRNMTFEGGIAPEGAELLVSKSDAQGSGILDRLKQSFVPSRHVFRGKVLTGPTGRITYQEAAGATANGVAIGRPDKSPSYLNNEYVFSCEGGECIPGSTLIVSQDNIYGEVISEK